MIRTITMTGSEIAVNGLNPGVNNLNANELDSNGITEAYGKGYKPEIMFKALDTNSDVIFISEDSSAPATAQYQLMPGKTLTLDFSVYVKTMNEFFVTGSAGDLLTVIVR